MFDGHTGIENKEVNKGGSGNFQLILSYLKQSDGQGEFIIHVTSNIHYSAGLQPLKFLVESGFTQYLGRCQFHGDKCCYREFVRVKRDVYGMLDDDQVQQVHSSFKLFASKIGELFQLRQKEFDILENIGSNTSAKAILSAPTEIEITEKSVPLWVNDVKFPELLTLEQQRNEFLRQINDLSVFLPLLYSTGDVLEEAVIKTLDFLGLKTNKAPKGFTADILAQTGDGSRQFGIEVTGTNNAIKKDSNKLTQVLDFERIKEHGEKTILIANTHNTTPIAQRSSLEDFTQPVIDFLGLHPIMLMTSWDLYRLVGAVLEGSKKKESVIEMLYTTNGRLKID
jgi:hypothetical protein